MKGYRHDNIGFYRAGFPIFSEYLCQGKGQCLKVTVFKFVNSTAHYPFKEKRGTNTVKLYLQYMAITVTVFLVHWFPADGAQWWQKARQCTATREAEKITLQIAAYAMRWK